VPETRGRSLEQRERQLIEDGRSQREPEREASGARFLD
jgi:hypothetical protein